MKREDSENLKKKNTITALYKAQPPYMPLNRPLIGYKGVICWDCETDKIQCIECGKWYESLISHIVRVHKMSPAEYKEIAGLDKRTPLCNMAILEQMRINGENQKRNKKAFKAMMNKGHSKKSFLKAAKTRSKASYQRRNKFGTCEYQLKARFDALVDSLERLPRFEEVTFGNTLQRYFGSYNEAVKTFGYIPNRDGRNFRREGSLKTLVQAGNKLTNRLGRKKI